MCTGRFTFGQAQRYLASFTNYEKAGMPELRRGDLERMAAALERIGNPQRAIPAVHVTGSKGKGTCCLVLEALLSSVGLRVGTYLSPHVERVTERIRAGGREISRAAFARGLAALRSPLATLADRPTYFEVLTALAWRHFAAEALDVAVVEAGIGGAHDATAVLDPRIAIVTSIEREHTAVLGRTEAAILRQKAAIAAPDRPLLLGPLKPALLRTARAEARRRGAICIPWNGAIDMRYARGQARVTFSAPLPAVTVTFPAPDRPFAVNATLALAAATLYLGAAPAGAAAAIGACRIPGRKEIIAGSPAYVLDVAHTHQSLAALDAFLAERFPGTPVAAVVALARDKPAGRLIPRIEQFAREIVCVRVDPVRGREAADLARCARRRRARVAPALPAALARAERAAGPRGVVCVCGSFVLVGQARAWLRRRKTSSVTARPGAPSR
jgi:dihydrofolate synthase/folylpolyglutamate synthase